MASFPVHALTVYAADDVTPLFTVSTDPGHAQPYLKHFDNYPEQEVDFARGAASIGQMSVQIVDVPTDPTDQTTGYLTGQLADANGYSRINGHRAVATEDRGSGAETVLDGVVSAVLLLDTFVTYQLELRDIRERERKTKAFETTDTPTVLPRGVLNGYGKSVTILAATTRYPIPPTSPLSGFYRADGSSRGEIEFNVNADRAELALTAPMREALENVTPLDDEPETLVYDRWKLLWRDKATGGAYTTLTQIAHRHSSLPGGGGRLPYSAGGGIIGGLRINNVVSSGTLPTNGQEIEVIVQYDGPVTEDWPYHLQDLTVGELLRNGCRGDYSDADPRIRYDESALLALTTPVRGIIKKPVDDFRAFAEKHAYPIAHAAPTLNDAGEISPITYLLPDAGVSLVTLDDSNCRAAAAGWSHGTEDAVNLVSVDYQRDFRVSPQPGAEIALSDQVRSVTQPVRVRHQASIDLLGEQPLEISSELLRSIGSSDGGPLFGDVTDEIGTQVATRVGRLMLDRFPLGGQYFALEVSRDDTGAEGLREGDWVTVGVSWMPDYLSGERGASRLAQVVSRRNLSSAWAALTLIDAGSAAAPLGTPTLGTITVDSAGVVSVPVTALATGDPDARIDYAVNATEPTANSELWTFLGRADAIETLTTPPLPAGGTAWIRARSEDVGRRPSAYTTAVSIAIPQTPRVLDATIEIDSDGVPTVRWTPNQFCLGVRVGYEVHGLDTVPTYPDTVEADAADGETTLSDVRVAGDNVLSVEVTPFPGWTGSAVSGTAGPAVRTSSSESVDLDLAVSVSGHQWIPSLNEDDLELKLSVDVGADVANVRIDFEREFGGASSETTSRDDLAEVGVGEVILIASGGPGGIRIRAPADEDTSFATAHLTGFSKTGTDQGTAGRTVTIDVPLPSANRPDKWTIAGEVDGANDRLLMYDASEDLTRSVAPDSIGGGGGASELSDLSDVGVTTPTNRNALMADGDSWESRALQAADVPVGSFGGSGLATFPGAIRTSAGSAASPAHQIGDANTGWYRTGTSVRLSIDGTDVLEIDSSGNIKVIGDVQYQETI